MIVRVLLATAAPFITFLLQAGGVVGASSALGTGMGAIGGALWVAAGERVSWSNCIGVAGGLGAVFGFGVLLWAIPTGNLL